MREFHPGIFQFKDQDIPPPQGATTSAGQSLSGIDQPIRTDGGGYLVAQFSGGRMRTPQQNKAWRAITAGMDGGAAGVIVFFCDRRHQPVGPRIYVPHSDGTPFSDETLYASAGATAASTTAAALRATSVTFTITSEKPLEGGEWFSVNHATWGWRAYTTASMTDNGDGTFTAEFRPPLREAIPVGTALEFDDPRCQMRLAQPTSSTLNIGKFGDAAISFVEDMRKPA